MFAEHLQLEEVQAGGRLMSSDLHKHRFLLCICSHCTVLVLRHDVRSNQENNLIKNNLSQTVQIKCDDNTAFVISLEAETWQGCNEMAGNWPVQLARR